MTIQLSDHFTYKKLLRFTLPSIIMMVFTSVYGVVDGFFVSNFAGKTPFAAVNFIMPFLMLLGAFGFMFGTGGSAIVAKLMGEGQHQKANRVFSMLVYVSIICGVVITVFGFVFMDKVAMLLGASGEMLKTSILYGRIVILALPAFMLQLEFQSFFVTAEKPQLGLWVTVAAGVTNMVLDALFVAIFKWGLVGAACATAISQVVGGMVPVIYFYMPNTSLLRLGKCSFDGKSLLKTCTNGSSELMSNISMSLVGMLYNIQLLAYAGENGVAAYGVLMYINFVFLSAFIGYSIGTAPVISYHFGAQNTQELKSLLKKSIIVITLFSFCMVVLSLLLSRPLSQVFVGYDQDLLALTIRGFLIFSFSFLFAGFAIFGSGFFTALNNGLISALISFLRTLVFQSAAILIFPLIWEVDGIWFSVVAAEFMAAVLSFVFMFALRKKYRY